MYQIHEPMAVGESLSVRIESKCRISGDEFTRALSPFLIDADTPVERRVIIEWVHLREITLMETGEKLYDYTLYITCI